MENFSPWGLSAPYIHVYDHNIQTSFFSETARPIKAKLHVEHPWERGMKVYINGHGHMTKMAAMAINSKNVSKSSSSEQEGL